MSNYFVPIIKADFNWHHDLPGMGQYDDMPYAAERMIEISHHVFIKGNNLIHRWKDLPNDLSLIHI